MLRPIPRRILKDTAVLHVQTGTDVWQAADSQNYNIKACHIQNSNETRRTTANTEVVLAAVLFCDAVYTKPKLDYIELQAASQAAGGTMRLTCQGQSYNVLTVDAVPDDLGAIHHYEMGLV